MDDRSFLAGVRAACRAAAEATGLRYFVAMEYGSPEAVPAFAFSRGGAPAKKPARSKSGVKRPTPKRGGFRR